MTTIDRRPCTKCGTPEGANLGACSFGGYCDFQPAVVREALARIARLTVARDTIAIDAEARAAYDEAIAEARELVADAAREARA